MASKNSSTILPETIEWYKKLVETVPSVEVKGAAMPYTSHNGHMFSFLDKEGKLGLRLTAEEREHFMAAFNSSLCTAHGTVLKEYVEVPDDLLRDTEILKDYFHKSFNYVDTLKPKAVKK